MSQQSLRIGIHVERTNGTQGIVIDIIARDYAIVSLHGTCEIYMEHRRDLRELLPRL